VTVGQQWDGPAGDRKLVWACTCGEGGIAFARGTDTARSELDRQAGKHLREREREGHRVDVGAYAGSLRIDSAPRPLLWHEAGTAPDAQRLFSEGKITVNQAREAHGLPPFDASIGGDPGSFRVAAPGNSPDNRTTTEG
jgi:hypothetical protein